MLSTIKDHGPKVLGVVPAPLERLHNQPFRERTGTVRMATLEFAPPPKMNFPAGITYRDVDPTTGEESVVPVSKTGLDAGRRTNFHHLARLALAELARKLNESGEATPDWQPTEDEAIYAAMAITQPELTALLLGEVADVPAFPEKPIVIPEGELCDLPKLFSAIGVAFESIKDRHAIESALFAERSDREFEPVRRLGRSLGGPLRQLTTLFGLESQDTGNLLSLKLCGGPLTPGHNAPPLSPIADLDVATALAWMLNLLTSGDLEGECEVGIWLASSSGQRCSEVFGIKVVPKPDGVAFDLPLTMDIGAGELRRMAKALSYLVEYWGMDRK